MIYRKLPTKIIFYRTFFYIYYFFNFKNNLFVYFRMSAKLKTNQTNLFNVTIIIDSIEYLNQTIQIDYYYTKNKKYFYKIYSPNEILIKRQFFNTDYVEGVKGFGQHIVSNKLFHLVFKEKTNSFELITWNNTVFINGLLS